MDVTLNIILREDIGTKAAKRYRKRGFIPVELYGKGEENFHGLVKKSELIKLLHETHGESVIINANINGKTKPVIIKDMQLHPVRGDILHVDLQILHAGEEVEVEVPVVIVGEAPGVKAGGVMEVLTKSLAVRAKPANIPPHIEVDVSKLNIGDAIHVKDIPTKNFTIAEDPDTVVVVVVGAKAEEKSGEEGAEGQ
ncbi:MAG: 50S ribosomal protein L25 [candidate division WOR-3 bacterium]